MKNVFIVLVAAFTVLGTSIASAQSPSEQLGVGASIGWFGSGGHVVYALDSNLHVGTQFGLLINDDGDMDFTFAPYGKYFISGLKTFRPFVIGQFYISSTTEKLETVSSTGIRFGGGAEYFIGNNLGIFAQIAVFELPFSPSDAKMSFGILTPAIGIEWFF